ncbi:MAG: (Fe-S)-binding protein [Promethearchaeia archaeon]
MVNNITQTEQKAEKTLQLSETNSTLSKIYQPDLKDLLYACYQCARCTGVCQLSKVQDFKPSRIIQKILEGFEEKVLESGVLWNCLMCNSCLQDCPEEINFADIVRMAKYKMVNEYTHKPEQYTAHKGIYPMISEIMSNESIEPKRNLNWIPDSCSIAEKGNILYHVGCLPYFKFEFEGMDSIGISTIKLLSKIEKEPIVVLENENCCGHDLYWGQGNFKAFIKLARKNIENFEKAGISTIITTCAEGYRTFKVDYPMMFEDFNENYKVMHIIEYLYDNWKKGKIEFRTPEDMNEKVSFSFHDPCRISRFLPKTNKIMDKVREIFSSLSSSNYDFREMEHHKENALCCGVSSWMNCNERSKAMRYKRLLEAKEVGEWMITTCPKCIMHFKCLQEDFDDVSSLKIKDFTEFIYSLVKVIPNGKDKEDGE